MAKAEFAKAIIGELSSAIGTDGGSFNSGTATNAGVAIAKGITNYLLANTQIGVAYNGIIPGTPPVPDICTDNVTITGQCAPLSASSDFNAWVGQIEANIMAGFMVGPGLALVTPMSPTPVFIIPGLTGILNQGILTPIHQGNMDDPQQAIWEAICEKIITWLETMAALPTYPASHITSTGVATKTTVKIQ